MEPLFEQPQGTVRFNMTTRLTGQLEECQNPVARHDHPVLVPEVGLVPLPLFLVDQDGLQTLPQALVDVSKFLQLLDLFESIWGSDHGHVEVQVYIQYG